MAHLLSSVRSHPPAAGIVGMAPTPGLHVVAAFGGSPRSLLRPVSVSIFGHALCPRVGPLQTAK